MRRIDARANAAARPDERYVQRRLVREQPVRRFAVLAEPFAVIRGQDDERAPRRAGGRDGVEDRRQRRVGGGDFAEIGSAAKRDAKGSGGAYGKCGS